MADMDRIYEHKMIRLKYASAYFKALSKIQAREKMNTLNEYVELTSGENEALMYYLNDNEKYVSRRSR